jgi:hypothetical protein
MALMNEVEIAREDPGIDSDYPRSRPESWFRVLLLVLILSTLAVAVPLGFWFSLGPANPCDGGSQILPSQLLPYHILWEQLDADSALMVLNSDPMVWRGSTVIQWKLITKSEGARDLGDVALCMGAPAILDASPDRKYLAVISAGEGHPCLEVLDLAALLEGQGSHEVYHAPNVDMGTISLDGWQGDTLLVRSDLLLTLELDPKEGSVWNDFPFDEEQSYAIEVPSGRITALGKDAKDPVHYFAGRLASQDEYERESAVRALGFIKSRSALPALEQAREAEKNPELRERMALVIDRIKNPLP